MSESVIRTYEARDVDAVWALHREGLNQTTPEYPEVLAHYEADLRDLEAHYLGEGSHFWVAELKGRLVGMAGASGRMRTRDGCGGCE